MTIDRTKLKQMHDLMRKNGYTQDYSTFEKGFVGNENYSNRKRVYDLFTQNGADIGATYEEFMQRMQAKPQPKSASQKPQQQASKPQTAAQMAKSMGGGQKQAQQSTATPSGTDYMKNWQLLHKRDDQMTPVERAQASNMRTRMQNAQRKSMQQEQRRPSPINKSRVRATNPMASYHESMGWTALNNSNVSSSNEKNERMLDEANGSVVKMSENPTQTDNEVIRHLSTPDAQKARIMQQRQDDARNLAEYEVGGNRFTHNDNKTFGTIGNDIFGVVDASMKEADELTRNQYQQNLEKMGGVWASQYAKDKAFRDAQKQEQKNRQDVLMKNISGKIQEIYSQKGMQQHIIESADKLNMGVEEYVDKYVTPQIMTYAQKALSIRNKEEIMPHGTLDYIAKNLTSSILGMVVSPTVMSRDMRQRMQEGIAISDGNLDMEKVMGHKDKTFRSGMGTRFLSTAANMAVDSGPLAVIGAGANTIVNTGTKVLTNGLVKAGVMKAGAKLTAQQLGFKVANMTMAQKIASGLMQGSAKGALNLGGYSGITAALSQASTGDDTSLSAIGKAGLEGFGHGATTGAIFGVSGAIMAPWVSKFGINGMETSTAQRVLHGAQKVGATAVGLGVEAGTMMVADNVTSDKDISVGTWLEDVVMVGAFKAGEPRNYTTIGKALYGLTHNTSNTYRFGKDDKGNWRSVDIRMTKDEQNELVNSVSGKNLMDAFVNVDKDSRTKPKGNPEMYKSAYNTFMNDPNVSQSTKEKVNAAMGLFNTTRDRSYRSENDAQNKQILEYSKNGTLLTRTSYKNASERDAIMDRQKAYRDNEELLSLVGQMKLKDRQYLDDNKEVTSTALDFLKRNGYDDSKEPTDPINSLLIEKLRNPNSDLYKRWCEYADRWGTLHAIYTDESWYDNSWKGVVKETIGIEDREHNLLSVLAKDPMKRTERENEIARECKRRLETALYPDGKPHAEQSESQGKSIAEDNNLGTDKPSGGAVVSELNNLREAENKLEQAMASNDLFSENFKELQKKGLTNPQIYDWMIQNGMTEEELAPFADYINANARVQGMQQATQQAIEQHVSSFVQDWTFHGTMNGEKMNGEQALYVKDKDGRVLIVGNGEVAFDSTGKAKEDVGDMLVCLDPTTREMVYVKAEDTTLFESQEAKLFEDQERNRLQMINSQPYNQAAQEQAMQDAAKPQPKEETQQKPENGGDNGEKVPQDNTTSVETDTTSPKDNTTKENLLPQEQPQHVRKFADGTDVPMTKDSKGRPTPDYGSMKPEQAAEILMQDFGENAEKVVDGQIKKAEKALKDAEKMKVDYTAEPNDILEQQNLKDATIAAAKEQLEHAQNIKKAMTAKKVAETVAKPKESENAEGAHEAESVAAEKFQKAPRIVGNKRTRMLADGETKIRGHYEIVPAESLTPSHDVNNGYKKSEGFPVDENGHTINDRDYENDKAAQVNTDYIASKYNGQAIEQVPVVSDEGIVYDGNGRTMAGQKAAKDGTDKEYINDLLENAENFGFTREQIEQSGIEHPRVVLVTDERLPYDTATFAKFNRNEKKSQSNTEQAVAKAKTLTSDEVGAIVADIEGNGSLDAFFNNPNAINDLIKTLQEKGVIGQNEVAGLMEDNGRLNAQGREYVKNLLLGSIFKPDTIRMLGIDGAVKNKAIAGIRAIMDNMKLGDYSLRDEIDQAIQLLYEARQGGNTVDTLLRTEDMFNENAADRYPSVSQMMALALEGKASDFRDLLDEYNHIAKERNTGEGDMFSEAPTKEELVNEYLKFKDWKDYGTRHQETERGNDVPGVEKPQQETSGGNEPESESQQRVDEALKSIATEITKQTGIEVVTDDKVGQSALEDAEATDSDVKFHKETDEDVLNQLNSGKTIKVYRAMQVIDGKLYPPMAAAVGGKRVEANELGVWIRADENPDLAIPDIDPKTGKQKVDKKTGELKWKFKLDKGGKDATGKKATDVNAAYNPYWHMSRSPLNDQFKSAWIRPNIVVVECEVPVSELTSGYKAERAKDAVGEVDWKSGSVSGEVFKQTGRARKVILSRWCKPVRVLDDAEVAQRAKEFVGDAKVTIPENVLTPKQRIAFEEAGFKIGAPEKGVKKSEQILEALEKGLQIDNTVTSERKEFRSANGEVYGFTVDGKIYLDTKKMKPETPLHEYTHLWTEALRNSNPTEWENVKKLFDEVDGLKEEVSKLYPELKGDDLYEEMITTFSGREGAKKLEEVVRGIAKDEGKSVEDSAKAKGFIGKVKEALQKYWKGVADMLHIHFTSAEEVADKVLADWAKGVNPADIKTKEDRIVKTDEIEKERDVNGVTYKRKFLVDGDKEVWRIDPYDGEPYYEYDGKKFGGLREVTDYIDSNPQKTKEPSSDPMQGIKDAANSYHEEKIDAARKAYAEAKEGGNADEIKHAAGKLKALLNEKYKAQGMGFVQRQKEIAKEIGEAEAEKIDKPWSEMDGEERMATAEKKPLTEDEIRNNTSEENQDLIEDAIDYLNGNHGFAQQLAYLKIYEDVRNRHENATSNSGAEDGAQLAPADNGSGEGLGLGTGRESGGTSGELDRGTGTEGISEQGTGRENREGQPDSTAGERGNIESEGDSSRLGGLPSRDSERKGSGNDDSDGTALQHDKGRGSGNRPVKSDAKRKPTAKQGTTWRGRTEAEIKQEAKDAKAGLKAALAEMLKRGRGEASLSLVGLNSKQIEYVPELMKAVKRYGMSLIDQGIYKIKDWMNNIREGIHDEMKAIGFSDQDIDDFIKEMWNSKMTMDGETHTIAEWSSIYGNQKLREKLGEELEAKYQKQMAAEPIKVKVGDMKNIEETLPFLLPKQQEDVLKAETQFFGEEHADREHAYGKGYMFTNGTGTGKTYTGLGIAKRLAKQGKGRILFVTPSQPKVSDWIKDGKNLGLNIRSLSDWAKERGTTATTESGNGMVITTYANMRQNKKLLETEWDAVIYDESHRIMENKKGAETTGSMQHYMVSNRDENYCFLRLQTINPHYQKMQRAAEKFDALRQKEIQRIQKEYKQDHPSATTKDIINATHSKLPKDLNSFAPADAMTFPKLGKAYQDFTSAKQHYYNNVEPKLKEVAKNTWKNTKTIFLSATPFNTRENLDYAEGYIFKYPEDDGSRMSGRSRFYLDHFGAAYRYRYNRLEAKADNPEAVAKQEIAFSDYLQNTLGTMSGRIIDSPYDYSRDFPTVSPDHAEEFNNAVQGVLKTHYLYDAYRKTIGNYNYGSALFETMKVANIIQRMKEHLDAGRKIVVFHRRVETKEPLQAPFSYMLSVANEQIKDMKPGKERNEYIQECEEFRDKYANLLDWEQTLDYSMPREQIAKAFGKDNVLFFSGKETSKAKNEAVKLFNGDDSGKNIIVIQEASGKEGISLHDTTGKHQRVLITLGLPQSPITALQIEGRTYRIGNKSNAIFEYPILGLNSEMMLFGEKFNNQVSTTENLALGSQARNLRDSFANGVLEHSGVVPIDQQGVGGKEFDAPKQSDSDPFDDAVLDYYSNQKLNRNNREGIDYFPTPEPLGYKMMQWANVGEGDTILEPSAGHGAIARYAPKSNELLSIEPSQSLFTKLQLKAGGLGRKFLNNTFENYGTNNKHDVVVMNPPFGTAGATAIAHLDKAFKHLDEGGRVVALIPRGSTDKKFDKWYSEQKNVAMRAEVDLPDIVFQQAGTNVRCRVVVLDKISDATLRSKAGYPEKVDLSGHYDKIEDFFEDLRNVEMPDRIVDTQLKAMKKARTFKKDIEGIKGMTVTIEKNGISVFDKNTYRDYSISFPSIRHTEDWVKENYSQVYERFDQELNRTYNENSKAALEEMKNVACKLADMSEEEMQKYIADKKNGGTHFRMELGKTFSDTKENFDGVRDRAVEEKGIVMPNLKKESVKIVPVEKHKFGEDVGEMLDNAKDWAKSNLVTTGKSELPTMRDGTPYTISKNAIDKYLSSSAVKKSDKLSIHLSVLPKLTDVIHESIEAEIHPDYNKGEDGTRSIENGYGNNVLVHRLYGAVELDGKIYRVKTTMQEFRGGEENKPHSYEVTKIELLEGSEAANESDSLPVSRTTNSSGNELLDTPGTAVLPDSSPLDMTPSNSISAAKLLNGVEKSYDSGKKLLDESKDLTDGDTYFRNNDKSPVQVSANAPVVVKHVAEVAKKVGGKVNMVNSAEEVTNPQAKEAIEAGKKVTGWYDEKTGEVHLYMPNIHDRYTAEKTIWHETVGHKAMRGLIGNENYDRFLRSIWYDLDKPENAELKKLVDEERKTNPLNIYDAIEEGIARLAEEGRGEADFWRNLKNKVTDFLHEIGYRIAPNTKDVKYLLWLSKNLQKNPNDPYWKIRAEAVKYRLDHEDVPEVIAKDGMYHTNTDGKAKGLEDLPKAEYQEATDGRIHFRTTPSAGTALDRYHRALNAHGYMFTESYMDNMLSLKKLMTAIIPDTKIEDVKSSENPYILQNTMQGTMSNAAQMFERNLMQPLDKAMADVLDAFDGKKDDDKIRNFNLYMIAKHGLERNRVFFVRDHVNKMRVDENKVNDAKDLQNKWDAEKKDLGDKLRNGDIDLKEYYDQMDEWIRSNVDADYKAGEHDYSGFHGLQEIDDKKAPYDDAEAIASVMDSEAKMESSKKGSVKDFWSKVNAAAQYSLDCDYKNGLVTKDSHDNVSNMFDWYIPLRKFDEATAEDVYGYVTENGDPNSFIGSTLMKAKGRKSLSETNILAQIGAMGNSAINRGGNNAIKQAFARFIRNNGGQGLVTETNVWVEKKGQNNNGNPIWEETYPQIPEDATPDEISKIVSDFETDMKAKEANGEAKNISQHGDIGFKFGRAKDKSQHIVDVMIAGKRHSFIINGNPRAAQALNGLLEHKVGTVGKPFSAISRFMAQTCTSYNPEFVMRNMIRDFEFASSNLLAKEGARYTGVFEKYYAKVGIIEGIRNSKLSDFKDTGGFGLFAKYRNGTLDMNDKIQRYFKEFMENGGETGWVQVKNMKEWTEEYKRNIKTERNKVSKVGKGFYNAIFKNLENVNEIAENMARFATYCASRDFGRSVVRSTYDAKEVSTNFNRHGSGSEIKSFKNGEMSGFQNFRKQAYRFSSAWFRNTSMFFNAGIQSTNLLVKNFKNNKLGTIGYIASGPIISGMAMALLNNFLIANEDEKDRKGVKDPYGELPDYIRRNNLCVYVGKGEFITIPLAIEERAFYGLGDLAAGLTFSPNVSGQKNPWLDAVGCMSQLVPVADYLGNASFGKHPVEETVKAVAPSALSPFIEWAYNSDWKGSPIERDNKFDENQPSWMLAYKGTPEFLINLNKKANAASNDVAPGNEYMKGNDFLDAVTNPSGLQHFYSSYLGGAATFAERTLGLIKHGKDTETKDIPFIRSLFYTPSEQSSLQRTKSKWYNYKDEMEKAIANVDRLKSKNVPIDKRLENISDYYKFQNSKDAVKVRVIKLADKQMQRWKKLRDKSGDTESVKFANQNIDQIMMRTVEQLDKLN